jgi:hypothetical protein
MHVLERVVVFIYHTKLALYCYNGQRALNRGLSLIGATP